MSGPRRRDSVQTEEVPETGEAVLLAAEAGRVLALNAAGAAVWQLLDGSHSPAQIAAALAAAAGIAPEVAARDVEALLARLSEEGFLEG
ncbi:MAG: PqqD family protein [Planctomycetota bacterium]